MAIGVSRVLLAVALALIAYAPAVAQSTPTPAPQDAPSASTASKLARHVFPRTRRPRARARNDVGRGRNRAADLWLQACARRLERGRREADARPCAAAQLREQ